MNEEQTKRWKWLNTRWDEAGLQFWLMSGEWPLYLRMFRMEALFIDPAAGMQAVWSCGGCGLKCDNAEQNCPECGAPKAGREQVAVLKLAGRMPHGWMLTNIESPFTVEVHYVETGRPDRYDPERRVGRFRNCRVISQTTETPVGASVEVVCGLCTRYNIRCRAAFTSDELLNLELYRSA